MTTNSSENITDSFNYSDYMMDFSNIQDTSKQRVLAYYLMGIGGMTISCLGIIGNILSVIVLTTKSMRSSTYMYLAALAVCDTLVLIVTMLLLVKDTQPPEQYTETWEEPYYPFVFPYVHPIAVTFQVTSIWLTLAFTMDRYIMICHPFRAESMCSRGRARKVIVSLFVAGILFNLPRFFEYYTLELSYQNLENQTKYMYMIELTKFGSNEHFKEIVHSWLYLICVCGLPFMTLAVLNAFLMRAVHQSRKKGKEINACEKRRNDTTIMLIGVVVVFFICQGPALVSRMIWAFSSLDTLDKSYHLFSEVANFLVILNSAINIVPYYFFGKKFRKEFWRLFCKCVLDKEQLRSVTRNLSFSIGERKYSTVSHDIMEMNGVRSCSLLHQLRDSFSAPLISRDRDRSDSSECSTRTCNSKNMAHFYPNLNQLHVPGQHSGYIITSTSEK